MLWCNIREGDGGWYKGPLVRPVMQPVLSVSCGVSWAGGRGGNLDHETARLSPAPLPRSWCCCRDNCELGDFETAQPGECPRAACLLLLLAGIVG